MKSIILFLRVLYRHPLFVLFFSVFFSGASAGSDWSYTVRPGDTIWSVCREYTDYPACWLELPGYNKISEPRALSIGERLQIPLDWLKQPPVAATVVSVQGEALVGEIGKQVPLAIKTQLVVGDRIVTRNGFVTLKFADGSLLGMAENSTVVLDAVSAFRQTRSASIEVSLPRGEVSVRVPERKHRTSFKVKTPSAVAAVRGTRYRVNADEQSVATRSEVLAGSVALASAVSEVGIAAGYGAKAEQGEPVGTPVRLLSAPQWNLSCTDPGYAEWQSLPDAIAYRLVLLENDTSTDMVLSTQRLTKNHFTFRDIAEKCYQLKVSAIDGQGFNGLESQREFCYQFMLDPPVMQSADWVNGVLKLAWSNVQLVEQYRIEVSEHENFSSLLLDKEVAADQLDQELGRLPGGVFVRVASLVADRQSEYTPPVKLDHRVERNWLPGILAAIVAFVIL